MRRGDKPFIDPHIFQKEKNANDPYVVSDKTCEGCRYYGWLSSRGSLRMCTYAYVTGKVRPKGETCEECSVKELGLLARPITAFDEARLESLRRYNAKKEKMEKEKEKQKNEGT